MDLFKREEFLKLKILVLSEAHRVDLNEAWVNYQTLKLQQADNRLLITEFNQVLENFLIIFEGLNLNSDSEDVSAKIRVILAPIMEVIKKELDLITRCSLSSRENRKIHRQSIKKINHIKTYMEIAEADLLYMQMLKGGAVGAIIGGGITFCVLGPSWWIAAVVATGSGGVLGALAEKKWLLIKKIELYASERYQNSADNQQRNAATTLQQDAPIVNRAQVRI